LAVLNKTYAKHASVLQGGSVPDSQPLNATVSGSPSESDQIFP